jgi:hypothetical protein
MSLPVHNWLKVTKLSLTMSLGRITRFYFEADLQQALRNHQQAGRTGAIKVFQEEVHWMRIRAEELRIALRWEN